MKNKCVCRCKTTNKNGDTTENRARVKNKCVCRCKTNHSVYGFLCRARYTTFTRLTTLRRNCTSLGPCGRDAIAPWPAHHLSSGTNQQTRTTLQKRQRNCTTLGPCGRDAMASWRKQSWCMKIRNKCARRYKKWCMRER